MVYKISQETLVEMVGTTRSRVNFFMNKFKKLGFIEYNGGLKVNRWRKSNDDLHRRLRNTGPAVHS